MRAEKPTADRLPVSAKAALEVPAGTPARARRKPGRSVDRPYDARGYLYIAPALATVGLFFLTPLALLGGMALHDWPLMGTPSFRGVGNFQALFADRTFWSSLGFTAKYTALITPAIFLPAYGLAHLVNRRLRGVGVLRTLYFLPVVIGLGPASLLWVWLLNDQVGILHQIFSGLGFLQEPALSNAGTAFVAVLAMVVWKTVGFSMVLLLVGLQAIPAELYEAARLDGANRWQLQTRITLPLLRPTLALALIMSVVGSFLAFDQFFIMTGGGPNNSTITVVYWIYRASFTYFKLGYGAAMSLVLMVILTALTAAQLLVLRRAAR